MDKIIRSYQMCHTISQHKNENENEDNKNNGNENNINPQNIDIKIYVQERDI